MSYHTRVCAAARELRGNIRRLDPTPAWCNYFCDMIKKEATQLRKVIVWGNGSLEGKEVINAVFEACMVARGIADEFGSLARAYEVGAPGREPRKALNGRC